jgi:alpha-methylacyl-CoA racemase
LRPSPARKPPLEGVRVLDLTRLLPGPYCSLLLSDLGADVVKVEDTKGGDYLRFIPPLKDGLGGAFYALNRGKRSIALDLKRDEGRELFLRLVGASRVVLEGFRPHVLDRLGLGLEVLSRARKDLILCSITGYGQDGPHAERAGHDIDYLALSGVLAAGGVEGGGPALPGVQIADVAGGALFATIRILAALLSNEGARIDVSLTEGAMAFLLPWLGDLAFGGSPLRRGEGTLNGGYAGYGCYRAGDGRHLALGAIEPKFWGALCRELGVETRMGDLVAPREEQHRLRDEIGARLAEAPRDDWADRLGRIDACAEPVLEIEELATHPQHRERGAFFTLEDRERGAVELLRPPLGDQGSPRLRVAPRQGQHTDEILLEAGLSAEEIAALRGRGVIR